MNQYRPWEQENTSEAEYFKAKYLEARTENTRLVEAIEFFKFHENDAKRGHALRKLWGALKQSTQKTNGREREIGCRTTHTACDCVLKRLDDQDALIEKLLEALGGVADFCEYVVDVCQLCECNSTTIAKVSATLRLPELAAWRKERCVNDNRP